MQLLMHFLMLLQALGAQHFEAGLGCAEMREWGWGVTRTGLLNTLLGLAQWESAA
jgi:hypothetical protein